jgi:hypothetical protein
MRIHKYNLKKKTIKEIHEILRDSGVPHRIENDEIVLYSGNLRVKILGNKESSPRLPDLPKILFNTGDAWGVIRIDMLEITSDPVHGIEVFAGNTDNYLVFEPKEEEVR